MKVNVKSGRMQQKIMFIAIISFIFCIYYLQIESVMQGDTQEECKNFKISPPQNGINRRWSTSMGNRSMLLKNFILLNGDGQQSNGLEILVKNGIITEISTEIHGDFDEILNLKGRYLTPGLVDMHSHLGTDSWPEFDATSDTNEMSSNPVLPQLRSLDGINPDDLGFKIVNRVII
jgi:hypothetical protein